MIVSRDGTSYDTSDGSEQPHERSADELRRSDREQISRWEDDGPAAHVRAAPPGAGAPTKPAWSVLSLTNLLEAVRQLRDDPAEVDARQEREGGERGRLAAERNRRDVAAANAAEQNRNRNAWENT